MSHFDNSLFLFPQSIDAFVCVFLVICIGLCVDYSAHIAHAFIICEGTSTERSAHGFAEMGAAIFHGGTTTFLSLREELTAFESRDVSDSFFLPTFILASSIEISTKMDGLDIFDWKKHPFFSFV